MLILDKLRLQLKANSNDAILEKLEDLQLQQKDTIKELGKLKESLAAYKAVDYLKNSIILDNGVRLLVLSLNNMDNKELTDLMNKLKDKIASGVVVIGCDNSSQASLIVGVTADLIDKYQANIIVNKIASLIDGKGGGKVDLAIAGGKNISNLATALSTVPSLLLD